MKKILALIVTVLIVTSAVVPSFVFADVTPPGDLVQNAIASNYIDPFITGIKFAGSYGPNGSWSPGAFLAGGGPDGSGAWNMTGNTTAASLNCRMINSGYNNIKGLKTITFDLKSTRNTTLQFKKTYATAAAWAIVPAGYGTKTASFTAASKTVTIPSTSGQWQKITILVTDFIYNQSTSASSQIIDSDVINLVSYPSGILTTDLYTTLLLGVGSSAATTDYATIDNLSFNCGPDNAYLNINKVSMGNANDRMGIYGSWSGFTPTFQAGTAEDAISEALHININATGSNGAYLRCNNQFSDLSSIDVIKLRIKSNYAFTMKFVNRIGTATTDASTSASWSIQSTGNAWMDISIPFSAFYNIATASWINNIVPTADVTYLMKVEANAGAGDIYIDNIQLIRYKSLASFATLRFMNDGTASDSGLKSGTTDVIATLKNKTNENITGAIMAAAMFDKTSGQLVAAGLKATDIAAGATSSEVSIPLTMPTGGDATNYEIKVFMWENLTTGVPATSMLRFGLTGVI